MERVKNMTKKLMEQKDTANARAAELETEIESLKLKLEEVEKEKSEITEKCEEVDNKLEAVIAENEILSKDNYELELEMENNNRLMDSNKNELHNLTEEKARKEESCGKMEKQMADLIAECEADFDI